MVNLAGVVSVRALLVAGAMCLAAGAAPAPMQHNPNRDITAVDWRSAGGPLFPPSVDSRLNDIDKTSAHPGEEIAGASDEIAVLRSDLAPAVLRLPPSTQPFDRLVEDAANRHGLDPKLLHALVAVESSYQSRAVSPAGAAGLAQLMPGTAADLGVRDRFDPADNLNGGAAYLAAQLLRFQSLSLALAAFNAGPHRVARLGRVPNITETKDYVSAVTDCYLALAAGRSIRSRGDCRP